MNALPRLHRWLGALALAALLGACFGTDTPSWVQEYSAPTPPDTTVLTDTPDPGDVPTIQDAPDVVDDVPTLTDTPDEVDVPALTDTPDEVDVPALTDATDVIDDVPALTDATDVSDDVPALTDATDVSDDTPPSPCDEDDQLCNCPQGVSCAAHELCDETGACLDLIEVIQTSPESVTCSVPDGNLPITDTNYPTLQGWVTVAPWVEPGGFVVTTITADTESPNASILLVFNGYGLGEVDLQVGDRIEFGAQHQEYKCHTELWLDKNADPPDPLPTVLEQGWAVDPREISVGALTDNPKKLEEFESMLVELVPSVPGSMIIAQGVETVELTVAGETRTYLKTDLCPTCDETILVEPWIDADLNLWEAPITRLIGVVHQEGDQFRIAPRSQNDIIFCETDCAGDTPCGDDGCEGSCGTCDAWAQCSQSGQCEPLACDCLGNGECPEVGGCPDGSTCTYDVTYVGGEACAQYDATCGDPEGPCGVWSYADGGNGHAYALVTPSSCMGWADAQNDAATHGGTLATLTSLEEMDFVSATFAEQTNTGGWNNYGPWLGGFQEGEGKDNHAEWAENWTWVTGEFWDAQIAAWNSAMSEPNDASDGGEDCLSFAQQSASLWNDLSCTHCVDQYILELPSADEDCMQPAGVLSCEPGIQGAIGEGEPCNASLECEAPLQCIDSTCRAVCLGAGPCAEDCMFGFEYVDAGNFVGVCSVSQIQQIQMSPDSLDCDPDAESDKAYGYHAGVLGIVTTPPFKLHDASCATDDDCAVDDTCQDGICHGPDLSPDHDLYATVLSDGTGAPYGSIGVIFKGELPPEVVVGAVIRVNGDHLETGCVTVLLVSGAENTESAEGVTLTAPAPTLIDPLDLDDATAESLEWQWVRVEETLNLLDITVGDAPDNGYPDSYWRAEVENHSFVVTPWLGGDIPVPATGASYTSMTGFVMRGEDVTVLSPMTPEDLVCQPCAGECGPDVCGVSCGECEASEDCQAGTCVDCVSNCAACGPSDGCDGWCPCEDDFICVAETCESPTELPDCAHLLDCIAGCEADDDGCVTDCHQTWGEDAGEQIGPYQSCVSSDAYLACTQPPIAHPEVLCVAAHCATELAQCLSQSIGSQSCAAVDACTEGCQDYLATCLDTCPEAAPGCHDACADAEQHCRDWCVTGGTLEAQAVHHQRMLCLDATCGDSDDVPECQAASLQTPLEEGGCAEYQDACMCEGAGCAAECELFQDSCEADHHCVMTDDHGPRCIDTGDTGTKILHDACDGFEDCMAPYHCLGGFCVQACAPQVLDPETADHHCQDVCADAEDSQPGPHMVYDEALNLGICVTQVDPEVGCDLADWNECAGGQTCTSIYELPMSEGLSNAMDLATSCTDAGSVAVDEPCAKASECQADTLCYEGLCRDPCVNDESDGSGYSCTWTCAHNRTLIPVSPYGWGVALCGDCVPDCADKACGPDGCGGSCGDCDDCIAGDCADCDDATGACDPMDRCDDYVAQMNSPTSTLQSLLSDAISMSNSCGHVEEEPIGLCVSYKLHKHWSKLTYMSGAPFTPSCADCWGIIGACAHPGDAAVSDEDPGVCAEACDDPTSPACTTCIATECPAFETCSGVDPTTLCAPDCEGKTCGGDGCGGVCGACEDGVQCQDGVCEDGCTGGFIVNDWESLDAIGHCETITGNLRIEGDVLTSLNGVDNLREVTGDLHITDTSELTNMQGLETLETVGGDLYIARASTLHNLAGLESLETVGETLSIDDCDALINLAGLQPLSSVGNLTITGNLALGRLDGLSGLESVSDHVRITHNATLNALQGDTGLISLTSIGGKLEIRDCPNLPIIDGPTNLTVLGGTLDIGDNVSLLSLEGLENLYQVSGAVIIEANGQLTDLHGLETLHAVTSHFKVAANPLLTSLAGIEALKVVEGVLEIANNDALTNLDDAPQLDTFGSFHIHHNDSLCDQAAWDYVESLCGEDCIWAQVHDNKPPQCDGAVCGTDGCGGTCGTCPGGTACTPHGTCLTECDCPFGSGCTNDCADGELCKYVPFSNYQPEEVFFGATSPRGSCAVWPESEGGNGHAYEVVLTAWYPGSLTDWREARDAAQDLGGHLVALETPEESAFFASLMEQFYIVGHKTLSGLNSLPGSWMGGYQPCGSDCGPCSEVHCDPLEDGIEDWDSGSWPGDEVATNWVWVTEEDGVPIPMTDPNWAEGQPAHDNLGGTNFPGYGDDCLAFHVTLEVGNMTDKTWTDHPCTGNFVSYIVEYDTPPPGCIDTLASMLCMPPLADDETVAAGGHCTHNNYHPAPSAQCEGSLQCVSNTCVSLCQIGDAGCTATSCPGDWVEVDGSRGLGQCDCPAENCGADNCAHAEAAVITSVPFQGSAQVGDGTHSDALYTEDGPCAGQWQYWEGSTVPPRWPETLWTFEAPEDGDYRVTLTAKAADGESWLSPEGEVTMLLPLDGDLTDSSATNATVTGPGGTATWMTEDPAMGSGNIHLDYDGHLSAPIPGGLLDGEFTIEWFAKGDNIPAGVNHNGFLEGSTNFMISYSSGGWDETGRMLHVKIGGVSGAQDPGNGLWPLGELGIFAKSGVGAGDGNGGPDTVWEHAAVVRYFVNGEDASEGMKMKLFINGVENTDDSYGSGVTTYGDLSAPSTTPPPATMLIGAYKHRSDQHWHGQIDGLRITQGLARYTSNFTVPTEYIASSGTPVDNFTPAFWFVRATDSQGCDWALANGECLGVAQASGPAGQAVRTLSLQAGERAHIVATFPTDASGLLDIAIEACPSEGCTYLEEVCGDGVQDPAEACDDGNTLDGDLCSADCSTQLLELPIAGMKGVVTDTEQALMWARCAQVQAGTNNWQNGWSDLVETCTTNLDTFTYCQFNSNDCNGDETSGTLDGDSGSALFEACDAMNADGGFGGVTGWRVPTVSELRSLVFCSGIQSDNQGWPCHLDGNTPVMLPTIDPTAFPNASIASHWSASASADPLDAYTVSFNGTPQTEELSKKNVGHYVRCVRDVAGCTPDCAGKSCDEDDGCGSLCGGCSADQVCHDGTCALACEGAHEILEWESLAAIAHCETWDGDLTIQIQAFSLADGLEALTGVTGDLTITMTSLTNLVGLENLTSIGGDLVIGPDFSIMNISQLNLTEVLGDVRIQQVTMLPNLEGLEGLTSVHGDLYLGNGGLANLNGLDNVTTIGGSLTIEKNDDLLTLGGLSALQSIGQHLVVNDNDELTSLAPLSGLGPMSSSAHVNFTNNAELCTTEIATFIDTLCGDVSSCEQTSNGNNLTCTGDNEVCSQGVCVCVPACTGKECGDDGCGGECGTCADSEACSDNECVAAYRDNGDGTVSAAEHELVWMQCSMPGGNAGGGWAAMIAAVTTGSGASGCPTGGGYWYCGYGENNCNGLNTTGVDDGTGELDYAVYDKDAYAACETASEYDFAGYDTWRVPTADELKNLSGDVSLWNATGAGLLDLWTTPETGLGLGGDAPDAPVYWSSTSFSTDLAIAVNMASGEQTTPAKQNNYRLIRCVRDHDHCTEGPLPCQLETPLKDCAEIHAQYPTWPDGLYVISPDGAETIEAYCDMTTDGGGWTLAIRGFATGSEADAAPFSTDARVPGGVAISPTMAASFKLSDAHIALITSKTFPYRTVANGTLHTGTRYWLQQTEAINCEANITAPVTDFQCDPISFAPGDEPASLKSCPTLEMSGGCRQYSHGAKPTGGIITDFVDPLGETFSLRRVTDQSQWTLGDGASAASRCHGLDEGCDFALWVRRY